MKPTKVSICGIQGYAGQELLRLINQHPQLELACVLARKSAEQLYRELPDIAQANIPIVSMDQAKDIHKHADVLFLATPPEVSMTIASELYNDTLKIIDLSGAFRLDEATFSGWYGIEHTAAELIPQASYGLSPWNNDNCANSKLIANPGCYATCALMALIPLFKHAIIQSQVIIDAKSGVSGAGKKAKEHLMYGELAENFFPYKIGKHQHSPEILHGIKAHAETTCDIIFNTHLLPLFRGISMSIYADLQNSKTCEPDIQAIYDQEYTGYPLVHAQAINEKAHSLHTLKTIQHKPSTHINFSIHNDKLLVVACIDNLLKGAASQAIENVNVIAGLTPETSLMNQWSFV